MIPGTTPHQGGISSSVLSVFCTDKFALSQSDARISVAYNSCQWKTLTKCLMKCPQDHYQLVQPLIRTNTCMVGNCPGGGLSGYDQIHTLLRVWRRICLLERRVKSFCSRASFLSPTTAIRLNLMSDDPLSTNGGTGKERERCQNQSKSWVICQQRDNVIKRVKPRWHAMNALFILKPSLFKCFKKFILIGTDTLFHQKSIYKIYFPTMSTITNEQFECKKRYTPISKLKKKSPSSNAAK